MGVLQHSYLQLLNILIAALSECKDVTQTSCEHIKFFSFSHVQGDNVSISCLTTTTHKPNSFRLKLRRTNSDKDILQYPDPLSHHQRWSVRNDTGNVTVDLNDIVSLDGGQYECEVHMDSACTTTTFILKVKECKILKPVYKLHGKSSVTLSCPEHLNVMWEVVHGDQSTEITKYSCRHSESTKGVLKPLCERSIRNNTSLIIRDVVESDALWYRCRSNKTCYDVKLHVKDYETSQETLSTSLSATDAPASSVSNVGQTEDSGSLTAVEASVVSLCVVIALIICVILYLKKRKRQTTSQIEFSRNSLYFVQDSVYYSQISDVLQFPLYNLLENNSEPRSLVTFCAEQTGDAACKYVSQPTTNCSS